MAKVVFVSLYNKEALGIRYISSFLKKHNHQVSLVFFKRYCQTLKKDFKNPVKEEYHTMIDNCGRDLILAYNTPIEETEISLLINLLKEINPDLIGFSLTSVVLQTAVRLTELIRKELDVPIIWGGIEPTIEPDYCLKFADIICRGEGEEAVLELVNALDSKEDYSQINNLWFKKGSEIIKNPARPLIRDLDSLPFADFDYEDKYFIEDNKIFKEESAAEDLSDSFEIITSRGCPFGCTFCCNSQLRALYPRQKYLRRRSVESVIEELKLIKGKRQPMYIHFHDDVFTFDKNWIDHFADLYKKEINLPFWCNVHPKYTQNEIIITLKKAGLYGMTCGVQSGSDYINREVFKRKERNEDVIACARFLDGLGIKYNFDLITNNPFESEEDCRKTLDLLLELPCPVRLNNGLSKLSFFPGTKIKEMLEEKGIDKKVDEKMYAFYNRLYLLTALPLSRTFIKGLSKSRFFKENPYFLQIFLLAPTIFYNIKSVSRSLLPRELWLYLKKFTLH
ncbi:MAG: radical SAM protein [Actinobacteria bacterium]|nr:radical SAM protein [Actinomycetota bacterium]